MKSIFLPVSTRLQILIFCKRAKKEINIQYKYVYLQAHKERKVDDEPVEVWYLFRPTVINKTGDLSTEIAKFLFFRRRSKDLSLISLPINLENMGKIIALANQKGGVGKQRLRLISQLRLLHSKKRYS